MLIKGQDVSNIVLGNTLSDDGLKGKHFDYMLSNPPFGVEWKKIEKPVRDEAKQGYSGRFGPGLPRVSDGSLLFLLHLISKMRPAAQGGSRFGIVLNGSPLFTGGAGSGESEIRRYVLENDLLEAIVALPPDMFYNTGISTYVWILSNHKPAHRKGCVQLIDASGMWQKMRKSLGSKRKELSPAHIDEITRLFGDAREAEREGVPIARLSRVVLTHHTIKSRGAQPMTLQPGGSPGLAPATGVGTGHVQERIRVRLREIIEKVNDLFSGDVSEQDKLVYVNDVLKGKLLESDTLVQQAASNSKEQFANSPDLKREIVNAIISALDAHTSMSTQALNSESVQRGLQDILLNHADLYESLRKKSA